MDKFKIFIFHYYCTMIISITAINACFVFSQNVELEKRLNRNLESPQNIEILNSVNVIRIFLDESYGANYRLNIYNDIDSIFSMAGFQIVSSSSLKSDADLFIKIRGTPLSAYYINNSKIPIPGRYYSGALLGGSIKLEIPDLDIKEITFSYKIKPPSEIIWNTAYNTPEGAPFWDAYKAEGSLYSKYMQIVGYIGGIEKLSRLFDYNTDIGEKVAQLMLILDRGKAFKTIVDKGFYVQSLYTRNNIAVSLKQSGWEPMTEEERCAYIVATNLVRDWSESKLNIEPLGSCAIKPLVTALFDPDDYEDDHYRLAKEILARIDDNWRETEGAKAAVPFILPRLEDQQEEIRKRAIEIIGEIGDHRATSKLIDRMGKEKEENRAIVATALGQLKDTTAVNVLLNAVHSENKNVREQTAWALGEIADVRATDTLVDLLKDPEDFVRSEAMKAIGKIRNPLSLAALINSIQDNSYDYSDFHEAVISFGDSAVEPLMIALTNPSQVIRAEAATLLGYLNSKKSAEALVKAMKSGNAKASEALEKLGVKAVDALLADLHTGHYNLNTIRVLGHIKDPKAVPSLVRLLKQSNPVIRKEANIALGNIAEKSSVKWLIPSLKDLDPEARQAAAHSLGEIGDPAAVVPLSLLLKDKSEDVRATVAQALAAIKDFRSIDPLLMAFNNEHNIQVRVALIDALGHYNESRVIDVLLNSLKDIDLNVSQKAAETLGNFQNPQVIDGLLKVLQKQGEGLTDLRKNAAMALAKKSDADAIDALIFLVDIAPNESGLDFDRAATTSSSTLAQLGARRAIPAILKFYGSIFPNTDYQKNVLLRMDYEPLVEQVDKALHTFQNSTPGDTMIVKYFIEGLRNYNTIKISSEILLNFGHCILEPLKIGLDDPDEKLREQIILLLGNLGDATVIDLVLDHLVIGESCYVLQAAANTLEKLGNEHTINPIEIFLKNYQQFLKQDKFVSICDDDVERACENALSSLKNRVSK